MQGKIALLAIVLAVLSAFFTGALASAHSRPIRFDPAPGAVLNEAPSQITGWFTQPVRRDSNWSFLQVTDAAGIRVDQGEVQLSADRKQMTVGLRSGLGAGRYLVAWRTWDDNDGRIFGDCFTFFVGQAAADAALGANTRLDGGGACPRIDVSGTAGTPVAGGTPQATPTPEDDLASSNGDQPAPIDGSDVPAWAFVAGILGGLVVGAVGGALIGRR